MTAPPIRAVPDGVTVAARLTPKARRDAVEDLAENADGAAALRARWIEDRHG